jgi:hypothetical protein
MKSATVTVNAMHKSNATLSYEFDGVSQNVETATFTPATATGPISLTITASDKTTIDLEPLDFAWNAAEIELTYPKGDYRNGQKGGEVTI